jgi:hypothetical protein
MHPKALISRIAMVHSSTFGASNVGKLLVLSEPEAICQIDLSTLNAMTTVRLFTTGEGRCWEFVAVSTWA